MNASILSAKTISSFCTLKAFILCSALATLAVTSAQALAHDYHVSSAEIEFNPDSGHFEVALKLGAVDVQDLLVSLRNTHARSATENSDDRIVSQPETQDDKPAESERLIERYLQDHFFLSKRNTNRGNFDAGVSKTKWIGMETEPAAVWFYFELVPPKCEGELFLTNKVLVPHNKGQTNTAVLICPTGRVSLKTDAKSVEVALPPYK